MSDTFTTLSAAPQEWMRVHEAVEYSRLSRAKLYDLMNRGLIKSVSLRERGQIKGSRIISFDSLRKFMEKNSTGGEIELAATA